jgi:nucleoside-diphosphate-sugar epimerase
MNSNDLAKFICKDAERINQKINLSSFQNAKILITGASGLIGQYLIATFVNALQQGIEINTLYLLCKNDPPEYQKKIVEKLNVQYILGDISLIETINQVPDGMDFVFHAAGYGQPQKFLDDEIATILLNTVATNNLLKKVSQDGKFLFLSTSEIYSGSKEIPYLESSIGVTNTNHPRACYIEGKRCGEAIVSTYRKKGRDAKSIRLALAYGPGVRVDDRRVLNEVIKKGLSGNGIALLDSGASSRTYIYITDAVELIFGVMLFGKEEIYNVTGFSKTTIAKMAELIAYKLNTTLSFPKDVSSGLLGAPEEVSLSMKKTLTTYPKLESDFISFDEGLSRVIQWYRQVL